MSQHTSIMNESLTMPQGPDCGALRLTIISQLLAELLLRVKAVVHGLDSGLVRYVHPGGGFCDDVARTWPDV